MRMAALESESARQIERLRMTYGRVHISCDGYRDQPRLPSCPLLA